MAPEILQFHKYDAKVWRKYWFRGRCLHSTAACTGRCTLLAPHACGHVCYLELLRLVSTHACCCLLQADLWSIGTILFELLAGKPPFNGANHVQLLRNIERNDAKLPDHVAARLSAPCKSLLGRLLQRNPVERISFEEFFSHPFLTGDAGRDDEKHLQPAAVSQSSLYCDLHARCMIISWAPSSVTCKMYDNKLGMTWHFPCRSNNWGPTLSAIPSSSGSCTAASGDEAGGSGSHSSSNSS